MKWPCAADPQISDLRDLRATLLNNATTTRRIHDGNATMVTIGRARKCPWDHGTRRHQRKWWCCAGSDDCDRRDGVL